MLRFTLLLLLVAVAYPGFAQYGATAASPYTASAAPARSSPGPANETKAEHLHIAAEHLEAAGCTEEAKRVRQMEAEERSHSTGAFVVVDLRMIEFRPAKLAEISSERYGGTKGISVLDLLTKLHLLGQPRKATTYLPLPTPSCLR